MDELIEQKAVSEEIEETIGCELAGDIHTTKYGEYKVISTFSDTGESITDLLSAEIDSSRFTEILENLQTVADSATGKGERSHMSEYEIPCLCLPSSFKGR